MYEFLGPIDESRLRKDVAKSPAKDNMKQLEDDVVSIMPEYKLHSKMVKNSADTALSLTKRSCKLARWHSSMYWPYGWS
jgi:hypothetical protein